MKHVLSLFCCLSILYKLQYNTSVQLNMGVAILSPQDCLQNNYHHHRHLTSSVRNPRRNPNPNPNPNRSTRRKRNSPSPPPSSSSPSGPRPSPQARSRSPPASTQIRILKRGEDLSRPEPGPLPEGFYAGSAFVTSPPPSELPVPAFFARRNCGAHDDVNSNHEIACELRRVLKLC